MTADPERSARARDTPSTLGRVIVAGVLLLLLASCGLSAGAGTPGLGQPPPSSGRTALPHLQVVALGDSVTAGSNCDCTAFPELYAQGLTQVRGNAASAINLGVAGLDSDGLFAMLADGTAAAKDVSSADVVVITIGANDFGAHHDEVTSGACTGDCLSDTIEHMSAEVAKTVNRVHDLRSGHPTTVMVTGYWNVFEDGHVARRVFPGVGLAATAELTRRVNASLRRVAVRTQAAYVDLYDTFKGPDTQGDDTGLLADDGDHPNASGHALIAKRLLAEGLPGLTPGQG